MIKALAVTLLSGLILSISVSAKEGAPHSSISLSHHTQVLIDRAETLRYKLEKLDVGLRHPKGDRLAVYVSLGAGAAQRFNLQGVALQVDENPLVQRYFSESDAEESEFRELLPLYTSRLATGEHVLKATVFGTDQHGAVFAESVEQSLHKENGNLLVELDVGLMADRNWTLSTKSW